MRTAASPTGARKPGTVRVSPRLVRVSPPGCARARPGAPGPPGVRRACCGREPARCARAPPGVRAPHLACARLTWRARASP